MPTAPSSLTPPSRAASPATIHRFDAAREPLPAAKFGLSTHGFGLVEAIELARILGQLPPRCIVYAVEARSFELGASLSPELLRAVDEVAARVVAEADQWSPTACMSTP